MPSVQVAERDVEDEGEEQLPPFGAFVAALADIGAFEEGDDEFADAADDIIAIERMSLAMSVEVEIVPDDRGIVAVRGSTPTQYTETTVMPLFHHLTLHVGVAPDETARAGDTHGEG